MYQEATICALSSPVGTGGVAVIRVSGPEAFSICEKLIKGTKLSALSSHKAILRKIRDPKNGELLDEALVLPMKGPGTFTGEDTVEIDCHGGMYLCRRILEALIASGCHMAAPGEFTRRAFMNGRMDLTEAEAVMDMIDAGTRYSLKAASSQMEGRLFKEANALRDGLIRMLADIEVNIDYPEYDDLPEITETEIQDKTKEILDKVEELLESADTGMLLRDGLKVSLIGLPNVGKSSLLNRLLKEERAIVTDIPGTTRDVISEKMDLGGIPLKLLDTAGIRETEDVVENIGVERSFKAIRESDLVLLLIEPVAQLSAFPGVEPLSSDEIRLIESEEDKPYLILVNKIDQLASPEEAVSHVKAVLSSREDLPKPLAVLPISAQTGEGIDTLEETIKEAFFNRDLLEKDAPMVTNLRQKEALIRAKEALLRVCAGAGLPEDLLTIDLTEAADAIGDLIGKSARDDVIENIFSRFCLGK
ncbi:MAG: tRNA uridine-5-carboxymethylaminomethyl(34) synthesis GTPase MnmE [Firmicutes bacterium]|nr:tRNA uridine-5-carboxymethylaminomethyl(34) synthesis GTPase MnmE [Bacillota bacterium]